MNDLKWLGLLATAAIAAAAVWPVSAESQAQAERLGWMMTMVGAVYLLTWRTK